MDENLITINNQSINCFEENGDIYIAIRPICQILGVDVSRQTKVIREHPIFSSVMGLRPTTGSDGKTYEMICLPLQYIFGWIFNIHPDNVNEEARENLIKYQKEVCAVLYNKFFLEPQFFKWEYQEKTRLLLQLDDINEQRANIKKEIGQIDGIDFDSWRADRAQMKLPFAEN